MVHQLQGVNAIPDHHWALQGEAPDNDPQVLQEPWAAASQAESWTFLPPSAPSGLGGSRTPPGWAPCQLLGWLEVQLGAIQLGEGFICDAHEPEWGEVSHKPSFWWNSVRWVGSRTSCTSVQEDTVDGEAMRGKEVGVWFFFELWFPLDKCPGAFGSSISRFLRNQHTVLHRGCTHLHSH